MSWIWFKFIQIDLKFEFEQIWYESNGNLIWSIKPKEKSSSNERFNPKREDHNALASKLNSQWNRTIHFTLPGWLLAAVLFYIYLSPLSQFPSFISPLLLFFKKNEINSKNNKFVGLRLVICVNQNPFCCAALCKHTSIFHIFHATLFQISPIWQLVG